MFAGVSLSSYSAFLLTCSLELPELHLSFSNSFSRSFAVCVCVHMQVFACAHLPTSISPPAGLSNMLNLRYDV